MVCPDFCEVGLLDFGAAIPIRRTAWQGSVTPQSSANAGSVSCTSEDH